MKYGITKILHKNLEFKFNYEEDKIYVLDHLYKRLYRLELTQTYDLPFMIILEDKNA